MNERMRSGVLRAEVRWLGERETDVACALELGEDTVFVMTEALPSVGAHLVLRLSFPNAVAPFEAAAVVVQVRLSDNPVTPPGFVARFADHDREAVRAVVARLSGSGSTRDVSVLLLEDSRLVRDMFVYAVGKYFAPRSGRVHLDEAGDVATAWAMLETKRYDVAVVDHFLPDGDGASLVARIRSDPRLAATAIVGVSVGGADVRRAMLDAGVDVFLQKPIVLKDLFRTFELLMQRESVHAAGAA